MAGFDDLKARYMSTSPASTTDNEIVPLMEVRPILRGDGAAAPGSVAYCFHFLRRDG